MQMLLTRHRHYMVKCLAARARNGNLQKWVGFVYLLKYLRNGRKGSSGKAFPAPIKSEVALLMYRVVNASSQQEDNTLSSISIPRCGGTSDMKGRLFVGLNLPDALCRKGGAIIVREEVVFVVDVDKNSTTGRGMIT